MTRPLRPGSRVSVSWPDGERRRMTVLGVGRDYLLACDRNGRDFIFAWLNGGDGYGRLCMSALARWDAARRAGA